MIVPAVMGVVHWPAAVPRGTLRKHATPSTARSSAAALVRVRVGGRVRVGVGVGVRVRVRVRIRG